MSGWWIIGIQPDLLVFAANSTHPLLFLQVVEHLWITGSPHIDNLTESTSIGSRWIHVVGWNHVRGGKLLGMPSGYAQFWESMVHLPAPMFLFWWFFCPIFWWVVSNDILTASPIPSSFIHGNYWSDGEGCQNASSFGTWTSPWLQGVKSMASTDLLDLRFPGVIFLLLMVPLTHPEQIAGVAINLQAGWREHGTLGVKPDYQVPPVASSIFDNRIFHEPTILRGTPIEMEISISE